MTYISSSGALNSTHSLPFLANKDFAYFDVFWHFWLPRKQHPGICRKRRIKLTSENNALCTRDASSGLAAETCRFVSGADADKSWTTSASQHLGVSDSVGQPAAWLASWTVGAGRQRQWDYCIIDYLSAAPLASLGGCGGGGGAE